YQRDFNGALNKLNTNEYLVLAGTFHSVHALTSKISPTGESSGLAVMETEKYAMYCFQSLSGIKFLLLTDLGQFQPESILNKVYQLFADYVMKNPFYQLDMPIRCDQ